MLTIEELNLVDLLADAYNAFSKLQGDRHACDIEEFATAIHAAQHLVMIRSAVRDHPSTFVTIGLGIVQIR